LLHAAMLVWCRESAMLDPVTSVAVGNCRERSLVRGNQLLDSGVADGMASELVTLGVELHDEVVELVIVQHADTLGLVVTQIGMRHPSRATARRSIQEQLHGADHQQVVACA
jgi:hypothetical protein